MGYCLFCSTIYALFHQGYRSNSLQSASRNRSAMKVSEPTFIFSFCRNNFINSYWLQNRSKPATKISIRVNKVGTNFQVIPKSYTFAVAYAENFHVGFFIQWHTVVICIWCALFLTSQFDVIFMF